MLLKIESHHNRALIGNKIVPFKNISHFTTIEERQGQIVQEADRLKSKKCTYRTFNIYMINGEEIAVTPVNLNATFIELKEDSELSTFIKELEALHIAIMSSLD